MLRKDSYVTLTSEMRNKLDLKGEELIVYGIIYGFSQDDKTEFSGSLDYLSEWCGCSTRTVMRILEKLVDKKLISKTEICKIGNSKKYSYKVINFNDNLSQVHDNLSQVHDNLSQVHDNLSQVHDNLSPNNIVYNIVDNIDNIEKEINKEKEKKSYGEFKNVKLTDREYEKLKEIYGSQLENAISCLSEYIESSGKKYKSHYATMGKSQWVYEKVKQNNYQTSPIKSNVIAIQGEYNAYR
jgi:predicted transcriptional regulator